MTGPRLVEVEILALRLRNTIVAMRGPHRSARRRGGRDAAIWGRATSTMFKEFWALR